MASFGGRHRPKAGVRRWRAAEQLEGAVASERKCVQPAPLQLHPVPIWPRNDEKRLEFPCGRRKVGAKEQQRSHEKPVTSGERSRTGTFLHAPLLETRPALEDAGASQPTGRLQSRCFPAPQARQSVSVSRRHCRSPGWCTARRLAPLTASPPPPRRSPAKVSALFGFGKGREKSQKELEKDEAFQAQQEVLARRRSGIWQQVRCEWQGGTRGDCTGGWGM